MKFLHISSFLHNSKRVWRFDSSSLKIILIIQFVLLTIISFVLLISNPAAHYELSIYSAYPIFFWILFFLFLSINILTILLDFTSFNSRYWPLFLFLILWGYFLFFLIPVIRCYHLVAMGSDDILFHLGSAKFIGNEGFLAVSDVYPISHILMTITSFAGLSYELSVVLLLFIFQVLFILFFIILGRSLKVSPKYSIFFILIPIPLYFNSFHTIFLPSILSSGYIFLVFLCINHIFNNNNKQNFLLLSFIIVLFINLFHPLTSIFLIIIIISSFFAVIFMNHSINNKRSIIDLAILSIIFFFVWILQGFSRINYSINNFKSLLTQDITWKIVETEQQQIQNVDPYYVLEIFFKIYGSHVIIYILTFLGILFYFKYYNKLNNPYIKIYLFNFILSMIFGLFLLSGVIVYEPTRADNYTIIIGLIFCALIYSEFCNKLFHQYKISLLSLFVIIICVMTFFGIMSAYSSPWHSSPNRQITDSEYKGIQWQLVNSKIDIRVLTSIISYRTWPYYIFETEDPAVYIKINSSLPSHFGYDKYRSLQEFMPHDDHYIVTDDLMKIHHLRTINSRQINEKQFLFADFFRLDSDPVVNKIYTNSGFEIRLFKSN